MHGRQELAKAVGSDQVQLVHRNGHMKFAQVAAVVAEGRTVGVAGFQASCTQGRIFMLVLQDIGEEIGQEVVHGGDTTCRCADDSQVIRQLD